MGDADQLAVTMRAHRVFAQTPGGAWTVDVGPDGRTQVRRVDGPALRSDSHDGTLDVHVEYLGHGRVRLQRDGHQRLAWVVDAGDTRWVFVDSHVVQVDVADRAPSQTRRIAAGGRDSLRAPMPATVVRVLVSVGQAVERGDALIRLEAMKMELPLTAPHGGTVRAIHCAVGDLVTPDTNLIELDEAT
jgi:3-methylcrotonyl-CoA carboxylase alpha subunit